MPPDSLPAYLCLALTLEPVPAGATPDPFPAPAVRGMLGKALVDRYCPFGHPHCDQKTAKRPSTAHRPERAERAEGSAGAGGAGPQRPPTPAELCHLAEACPYGVLYAASRTRRPPYALYVPPADDGGPGAATVELTLYGPAWRTYPWALHALADALADRTDRTDRSGTGGGGGRSTRTSKRSRARLDLGGTVGRLTYGPPAAAFFHLLQAAEVLHLGKNPTFGCGRIRVELEAAGA